MTAPRSRLAGLLVLSAVGAELLAAYGDSTGDVGRVAFSVVFFAGLYGAPALVARDVVRRRGWGWGSLLWIHLGLGVAQACLIDQSLFAADYMGYEGWEAMREAAYMPALGFSAANVYTFVGGHLIFSFGAPTALAECWRPATAERPWLGRTGTVVAVLAYLATAGMIAADPESHNASAAQLAGASAVVLGCGVAAVLVGMRRPAPPAGRPHRVAAVFLVSLPLAAVGEYFGGEGWGGLAVGVAVLVGIAALLRAVGGRRLHPAHLAAVGFAYLLVRGVLAFTYFPLLGHVDAVPKYTHNVVMLAVVLAAGWWAYRRRSEWASAPGPAPRVSA
ncbi:hypothetical protein [Tsukamurella sp. 1534]|uniref:hypothetical protein n=1 Tax=Tsukamurella sp. 1534 TaxID=1151061 RepID=UPI000687839B|nr:hypothetical protein [Tsukamurella sp. 1534]